MTRGSQINEDAWYEAHPHMAVPPPGTWRVTVHDDGTVEVVGLGPYPAWSSSVKVWIDVPAERCPTCSGYGSYWDFDFADEPPVKTCPCTSRVKFCSDDLLCSLLDGHGGPHHRFTSDSEILRPIGGVRRTLDDVFPPSPEDGAR